MRIEFLGGPLDGAVAKEPRNLLETLCLPGVLQIFDESYFLRRERVVQTKYMTGWKFYYVKDGVKINALGKLNG